MRTLSIDIETYSSAEIGKCGVYRYSEAPDFEVLLLGYSLDGAPVQVVDLTCGEALPVEISSALTDPEVVKWAFNAQFERVCLSRYLGVPAGTYLDPAQWRCSMIWSAYLGLPLSLAGVGAVLGLEKQKLESGKDLIRYFCRPCASTKANGGRTRNLPRHAPDKWAQFKAYNLRDVETELGIQQRLARYPVPEGVWDEYRLDQQINDRGIALDMELVSSAIRLDAQSRAELVALMKQLTALDNPGSVQQMKRWLMDNGLELDSLGKKEVAAALKDAPEPLGDVLALRQQLAKSSVKKYQAMENAVCADGRARGMFQFYGANRTGRFSGRIIQLQNLPQNHIPDLEAVRELVRLGDYDALKMLYDSVPDVLSELIRTAFVPRPGCRFIVADFSAIEARVIAWLAGEQWRQDVFREGGDIYCQSASAMFGVPVIKHGINGHLRQKGKIAELACIAEGQLVLTDSGPVPIECVTTKHRVWDGEGWVSHEGLVYRGIREVITYEGLTATPDHLVWVEGQSQPIRFDAAAASGAHLVQTGHGGAAIRLGEDHQSRKALGCALGSLPCVDAVYRMWVDTVAAAERAPARTFTGMPALLAAAEDTALAGAQANIGKTALREPVRPGLPELRCSGHPLRVCERDGSRAVPYRDLRYPGTRYGARPDRQQRQLCPRQPALRIACAKQLQQACDGAFTLRTDVLALCAVGGHAQADTGAHTGRDNPRCVAGCVRQAKELAAHTRTARVYDLRNAGRHHRFTVSDKLVHNCGYGGSVGALKAMGALDMGLKEDELPALVAAWREANPNIVQLWWDVDDAAMTAVRNRTITESHGIRFSGAHGMLFVRLPSGRSLAYVKPRMGTNQFGNPALTYEGIGGTKRWERLETYGPKVCENIVQAISRDILCYAMQALSGCDIVAHVHDEVIIEAGPDTSLKAVCARMSRTPPWVQGLLLRADGFETMFYRKD